MKGLSLILILFILLTILLTACGGDDMSVSDKQVTESTTAAETKDMSALDELPQKDYDGYVFSMLSYPDNGDGHTDLDAGEVTGETLNDAIYNANRRVESRFNIKFNEMKITTWDQASKVLKKSVIAGEQLFDMAQMVDRDAMSLAMEGRYFYAMDELPYVDLDKAYYIQGANDTFSIGGTVYITYSAYMIGFYDCLHFMLFNKDLAGDYNIDDIYTLIRNGKWTVDTLYSMAKTAAADLDGDSKMTDADQYGIAYHSMDYWCGFWAAEGIRLIDKDDNDLPYFNVPGNEKLFTLFDKLFEYSNVDYNFDLAVKPLKKYNKSEIPGHVRAIELFENGQALFTSSWIYNVQAYLRDMEADYGIIRSPRWTKNLPVNRITDRVLRRMWL
jgi:ABC-type glycerol-3-phosphate transport system substrate-binding protein